MRTSHLALGLAHEILNVVLMPKAYSDEWWLCHGHLSFCLQKTEQVPGGHSLSKHIGRFQGFLLMCGSPVLS